MLNVLHLVLHDVQIISNLTIKLRRIRTGKTLVWIAVASWIKDAPGMHHHPHRTAIFHRRRKFPAFDDGCALVVLAQADRFFDLQVFYLAFFADYERKS